MKNKNNLILAVLVVLLIACIVSPLIYFMINRKSGEVTTKTVKKAVDTSSYQYTLNLYKSEPFYFKGECSDCDIAFTIPTESKDAKFLIAPMITSDTDPYILYDDNGLKVYNYKNSKVYKINLDDKYEEYKIELSKNNNELVGIVFYNLEEHEDKSKKGEVCLASYNEYKDAGIYNFKTDKIMFDDDYDYLEILDEDEIVAVKQEYGDEGPVNSTTYIFDINSGKKNFSLAGNASVIKKHTKSGVVYNIGSDLYNSKFKKIFSDYYNITSDGIYVMNKDKSSVSLYDANGKKLNSYNIVGNFQDFFDDNKYYLTIYNNHLYIRELNGSYIREVTTWKNGYDFNNKGKGLIVSDCDREYFGNSSSNMWGFEYFTGSGYMAGVKVCFYQDTNKILTKEVDFIQRFGEDAAWDC